MVPVPLYAYHHPALPRSAMMSADSFAYGLLETTGDVGPLNYEPVAIFSDTESEDDILKFYDNCQLYKDLVDENPDANVESPLYYETFIDDIAARLTQVLTTGSVWNVTRNDAFAFWSICQGQGNDAYIDDEFWCALPCDSITPLPNPAS